MRIVSLLPSATETLFQLGLGEQVVATSHSCDVPEAAAKLPSAMRTRVETTGTSQEIDEQVRSLSAAGEPLYVVDEGVLHHVRPDLIVTQDTCQVCAAGPQDVHAALMRIEPADRPELVTLHAHTLEDVLDGIQALGAAAGAPEAATALVDDLRARIQAVKHATEQASAQPTVAVLDWLDPPMAAGHWVPELVELAGGRPVLVRPGEPSRTVAWEAVVEAAPELLVLAPCGFGVQRARREAQALTQREGWDALPAVANGRVHVVDAQRYLSRPAPSLVEALERLAVTIHPGLFDGVDGSQPPALERL